MNAKALNDVYRLALTGNLAEKAIELVVAREKVDNAKRKIISIQQKEINEDILSMIHTFNLMNEKLKKRAELLDNISRIDLLNSGYNNTSDDALTDECDSYYILKQQLVAYVNKVNLLETEMKSVQSRLNNCIPIPAIIYMTVTSIAFTIFSFSFILQVFCGIYLLHPYYAFTGAIGSLGLFLTAFLSLRDWKEFIKNGK